VQTNGCIKSQCLGIEIYARSKAQILASQLGATSVFASSAISIRQRDVVPRQITELPERQVHLA